MEKRIQELEQRINDLESELNASIKREELLLRPAADKKTLKEVLKTTRLGKIASNPNSKAGKVIRLPRTVYRIIRHPSILRDIFGERNTQKTTLSQTSRTKKEKSLFAPIKFYYSDEKQKRVNLVAKKLDIEKLRESIALANAIDAGLRIITTSEAADPIQYNRMIKKGNIKNVPKTVEFYSSLDQADKKEPFELEIGKQDIFLTEAWGKQDDE
ncbi:hypothetical protein IJG20_00090 [Candidatus Saccharibacteria bacterium]|nr:hypothetical protein [Candidatus Saccharibacteria bacterium]